MSIADVPDAGVFVDRRVKVWLECNGEPYEVRSLKTWKIQNIADGVEIVRFNCPRCGRQHQSLRFV